MAARYVEHSRYGMERDDGPAPCRGSGMPAQGEPVENGTVLCRDCQRWIAVDDEVKRAVTAAFEEAATIAEGKSAAEAAIAIRQRKGQ